MIFGQYIEAWNGLCEAFPKKNTGSKILLTSRNKDVSLHADPRGFLLELVALQNSTKSISELWNYQLIIFKKNLKIEKEFFRYQKIERNTFWSNDIFYC